MNAGVPEQILRRVESGSIDANSPALDYVDRNSKLVTYGSLLDMFSWAEKRDHIALVIADGSLEATLGYLWSVNSSLCTIVIPRSGDPSDYQRICSSFSVHLVISSAQTLGELREPRFKIKRKTWFSIIETEFKATGQVTPGTTLLATSGSTGEPKFVGLSNSGILRNALDISSMLEMSEVDVSAGILPLSYSYGLSVLHSTLVSGGRFVFGPGVQPLTKDFRRTLDLKGVTHLPGVPFTHDIFEKIGLYESPVRSLKCVTQAGGRLSPDKVQQFCKALAKRSIRFHPMYGQTEASARIAIMPHELVQDFPGHVGHSVISGKLSVNEENSEIIFEGPNVMLGYAQSFSSLNFTTSKGRQLRTGDRGEIGPHGLLKVTGRLKRIAKINGTRVDLDAFSSTLDPSKFAVVEGAEKLVLVITSKTLRDEGLNRAGEFGLLRRDVVFIEVDEIPRLENGKPDLRGITEALM